MKAVFVVLLCTIVVTLGATIADKEDKNGIQEKISNYFSKNLKLQKRLNMEVEQIRGLLESINKMIEAVFESDEDSLSTENHSKHSRSFKEIRDIVGTVSSKNGKQVLIGVEKKVPGDFSEHLQLQRELNMDAEMIRELLEYLEYMLIEEFMKPESDEHNIVPESVEQDESDDQYESAEWMKLDDD